MHGKAGEPPQMTRSSLSASSPVSLRLTTIRQSLESAFVLRLSVMRRYFVWRQLSHHLPKPCGESACRARSKSRDRATDTT